MRDRGIVGNVQVCSYRDCIAMDKELIAVFARCAERLLIACGGVLALYFGYHLFLSRILKGQDAEIQKGDLKIKLMKVGPGVFFAIFGSAIMIYGIVNPLSFDKGLYSGNEPPSTTSVTPTPSGGKFKYGDPSVSNAMRQRCQAINTARQVLEDRIRQDPAEKIRLLSAKETLTDDRDAIIVQQFGSDNLKLAKAKMDDFTVDPNKLSESDRNILRDMRPWYVDQLEP
jgi:hypothetical protein